MSLQIKIKVFIEIIGIKKFRGLRNLFLIREVGLGDGQNKVIVNNKIKVVNEVKRERIIVATIK